MSSDKLKILLIADLHLCVNLREEIEFMTDKLPAGFYDVVQDGEMRWNNTMLVEQAEIVFDEIGRMARSEGVDLCMFLGDMVNTNWLRNVDAFVEGCARLPCPVGHVLGNHDIYLEDKRCNMVLRLDNDLVADGNVHWREFPQVILAGLDMQVKYRDGGSSFGIQKGRELLGAGYDAADVAKLERLVRGADKPVVLFTHKPLLSPDGDIPVAPGKIMREDLDMAPRLGRLLKSDGQLKAVVTGHAHYTNLRRETGGLQWTIASAIEYPCGYGVMEIDGDGIRAEFRHLKALADKSFTGCPGPKGRPEDNLIKVDWRENLGTGS